MVAECRRRAVVAGGSGVQEEGHAVAATGGSGAEEERARGGGRERSGGGRARGGGGGKERSGGGRAHGDRDGCSFLLRFSCGVREDIKWGNKRSNTYYSYSRAKRG